MKSASASNWLYSSLILFCSIILFSCGSRNDEAILKDVNEHLQGHGTNTANVKASVSDGVVSLTGDCTGENCADSLTNQVKEIKGVKEVQNNVTQARVETDLTLRTSVQSIISKYQGVQADVAEGVIVLRGSILRDQVQPLMNELSTLQAKKIDNQLAIQ